MTADEDGKKDAAHKGPSSFTIFKEDVLEHDPTPGCPACQHAIGPEGAPRGSGHTAACRRNFAEIFQKI